MARRTGAGCLGRLIDGPLGWAFDHSSKSRPRAEAFLKFASDSVLRTQALQWTVCKDGKTHLEASAEDKSVFLSMLFTRLKTRKDSFEADLPIGQKIAIAFQVADDVNGHYEGARIEIGYRRTKGTAHWYRVTALRFSRTDITSLFQLAEVASLKSSTSKVAKGGRPAAADWEGAALEMARRYYRDALKLRSPADVKKQLADWLAEQDLYPSDTVLRERARRYFTSFSSWDDE